MSLFPSQYLLECSAFWIRFSWRWGLICFLNIETAFFKVKAQFSWNLHRKLPNFLKFSLKFHFSSVRLLNWIPTPQQSQVILSRQHVEKSAHSEQKLTSLNVKNTHRNQKKEVFILFSLLFSLGLFLKQNKLFFWERVQLLSYVALQDRMFS